MRMRRHPLTLEGFGFVHGVVPEWEPWTLDAWKKRAATKFIDYGDSSKTVPQRELDEAQRIVEAMEQTGVEYSFQLYGLSEPQSTGGGSLFQQALSFITSPPVLLVVGGGLAVAATPIAAAGAATSAGSATVSGAELAALVEAGTVGAEGAFLEAAALTGSAVTFDTATGALVSAVLPTGGAVAFDPAVDAFAQFGVDPSSITLTEAAPIPDAAPEFIEDALSEELAAGAPEHAATNNILDALPSEAKTLVEKVMQDLGVDVLMNDAGAAVTAQLTQMGEAALAQELQQLIGGTSSGAAPGSYRSAQELDLYTDEGAALQSGAVSGRLRGAALPLVIGAGLGLLGILFFARNG